MRNMQMIEQIRQHPLYISAYDSIQSAEITREFCCHQMPHLLDVARIAYIRTLEESLGFTKELIYATALLHDIGKAKQYEEGIPHEIAGKEIAAEILADIPLFSEADKATIIRAICEHRRMSEDMSVLGRLLYESDKRSRACYVCPTKEMCNWDDQKKNRTIEI